MSPSSSDKLRIAPTLTDVLQLVAMQGQAPIVARFGLGLNRYTWGNPHIWRPCMNVWFGETKRDESACSDIFQSSESTRLMLYLKRGRRDLVELALSRGADPNLNSTALYEGRVITINTPLACAIASKTLGLVRLLLEHGADPNQVIDNTSSLDIETPVLHAVWAGNLSVVKLLVDEYDVKLPGAFPPGQVVPHAKIAFCKPLCRAIRLSRLSMVRYFIIEKGMRVNFPHSDRFKWCDEEQSWIPKNAMLWGVDMESDLQSYLDHAVCMQSSYMKWLAMPISFEMVTLLLDSGAIINYTGGSEELEYPLLNAVVKKRYDVVNLLLSRGANPNFTSTWDRKTSMIGAAENNDVQMTIALLGAGAHVTGSILCEEISDFYQLMEEQVTALHLFAKHGNAQGVQLVLAAGAEVDAEALSGLTPLLFAVKGVDAASSEERVLQACACCRLLVEAGADIHHVADMPGDLFEFEDEEELNDTGFLALTFAVDRNVPALVICLVDLGADFTRRSDKSLSLLMHAAMDGKFEVLQALVDVAQGMEPAAKMAFLDLQYQNDDAPDDESDDECNALQRAATRCTC